LTKSCSVYLYQNNPGDDIFNKEKGFLATWEKYSYGFSHFHNQHVSFNKFKYFVAVDEDCADCQGAGAGFQREFNEPATYNKVYIDLITETEYLFERKINVMLMAYKRVLGLIPALLGIWADSYSKSSDESFFLIRLAVFL